MSDLMPSYVQARQVLRQLQKHLAPLAPPPPPPGVTDRHLSLPPLPTFDTQERVFVGAWKSYLKWEESNPLELEEKDKASLISRIQGVYKKALIRMRFFGEIWYVTTSGILHELGFMCVLKVYGVRMDERHRQTRRGEWASQIWH